MNKDREAKVRRVAKTMKAILRVAKTVKERRPYEDDKPDGYLECDRDYFENNRFAAIKLLDLALKLRDQV